MACRATSLSYFLLLFYHLVKINNLSCIAFCLDGQAARCGGKRWKDGSDCDVTREASLSIIWNTPHMKLSMNDLYLTDWLMSWLNTIHVLIRWKSEVREAFNCGDMNHFTCHGLNIYFLFFIYFCCITENHVGHELFNISKNKNVDSENKMFEILHQINWLISRKLIWRLDLFVSGT